MISSDWISLREAANSIPSRPHINSVRRWILKGARGKKLDAKQVGGRWFTTSEAVQEFVDTPSNAIHPGRQLTASQRAATEQVRGMGL